MPREDRRILFDMSETYQALYKLSLKQDNGTKLIAGTIVKISQNQTNENDIQFTIQNPQTSEEKTISFSKDFVAAALMMFCRGAGIPLPRKAGKSVMIRDGEMILRIMV